MRFTEEEIRIEPGHQARNWSSCDYYAGNTYLFHERDYYRSATSQALQAPGVLSWLLQGNAPGDRTRQWFDYHDSKSAVEAVAQKHGGVAIEEFYAEEGRPPNYFLGFNSTEKALAFCRSEDFDKLCLTVAKL